MKMLQAVIADLPLNERRGHERWRVELTTAASSATESRPVLIEDLSETGLMFRTGAPLTLGETILVDLPGSEATEATVVWSKDDSFGCMFRKPIPASVISAAILRAPVSSPARPVDDLLEEFPVGAGVTVEELGIWKAEFERTRGPQGYRLVAFRQLSDGLTVAIAARPGA